MAKMKLSDERKNVVINLINIAWATGNVKSPREAQLLESFRNDLLTPVKPKE